MDRQTHTYKGRERDEQIDVQRQRHATGLHRYGQEQTAFGHKLSLELDYKLKHLAHFKPYQ